MIHSLPKEMPEGVKNLLAKKYNIIDHFVFGEFDLNFSLLVDHLNKIRKNSFESHSRIIIEHMDTDFYFRHCAVGINLLNFFNTLKNLDYPYFVFIFYTNHIGLSKEIDLICKDVHSSNRPMVIESFIGRYHYNSNQYENYSLDLDKIQHHALCMMNLSRTHRNAVYHSLKPMSPDKIALQATK
jgi:hypothetical protein